jgi:hypothetical protein
MTRLEAKGPNGEISVDDDWVTISRKNRRSKLTHGFDGEKRIPISSITAVQFKAVGKYGSVLGRLNKSPDSAIGPATGYIQFAVLGSQESKRGLASAQTDENTVMFNNIGEPEFAKIRDFVEKRILELKTPSTTVVTQEVDVADQILKLSNLVEQGILTKEEFESQKSKLLGS